MKRAILYIHGKGGSAAEILKVQPEQITEYLVKRM